MKIRTAFVSNSSSSSFVISKSYLSEHQIVQIKNHSVLGKEMNILYAESDSWNVDEDEKKIFGSTWMDNFDMCTFLEKIGVPMDQVEWDD